MSCGTINIEVVEACDVYNITVEEQDCAVNITVQECFDSGSGNGTGDIDGGSAYTIYTASQIIDGGSAFN